MAEPPADESVSLETVYRLLAHPRRRRIVAYLARDGNAAVTRSALTDALARDGARGDSRAVALDLYHAHLPKLDEAGFVSFDPDADRVHLTDRGRRAADLDRVAAEFFDGDAVTRPEG